VSCNLEPGPVPVKKGDINSVTKSASSNLNPKLSADNIYFNSVNRELSKKCQPCHAQSGSAAGHWETGNFSSIRSLVDTSNPFNSLLLLKGTGKMDHGGGVLIKENDTIFKLVYYWAKNGALENASDDGSQNIKTHSEMHESSPSEHEDTDTSGGSHEDEGNHDDNAQNNATVSKNTESSNQSNSIQFNGASLSESFGLLGCASSTCHGASGNRMFNLTHDSKGNPVTDLSQSQRNLESWITWIRIDAKSPMPTYTSGQYPDSDLKSDYQVLTGRDL
jgi:hypothetical protein